MCLRIANRQPSSVVLEGAAESAVTGGEPKETPSGAETVSFSSSLFDFFDAIAATSHAYTSLSPTTGDAKKSVSPLPSASAAPMDGRRSAGLHGVRLRYLYASENATCGGHAVTSDRRKPLEETAESVSFSASFSRKRNEKTLHAPESYATTTFFVRASFSFSSRAASTDTGCIRRTEAASPQCSGNVNQAFSLPSDDKSPRRYATTSPSSRPHTTASPTTAVAATPAFLSFFGGSDIRDAAVAAVGRGGGASPVAEAVRPGVTMARRRRRGT